MYAVGVDVSKGKSTVAVLRSKSEVVMRSFNILHNAQELADLTERLNRPDGASKLVMEHTGNEYEAIAMFLR